MSTADPRLGLRKRRLLRAEIARSGAPCALCDGGIDYDGPWDLDEIVPRAFGGDPLDPYNVQPAHTYCNRAAGARIKAQLNDGPLDADW